uniref:Nudix hydrolase domain-containing protein n=1 Tax=Rhabditophanes sp. KR3021 TaxID=114890 RepID=A0AC35TLX6_9BILA
MYQLESIEIFVNEMFQGTAKAKLAANLARAFYIHKSAEKVSDEDELDANHFYFYVACLEKFDDNCKVNPDIAEDHQWLTKEEVAHDIKPISVVKALQPTILNAKWN